MSENDLTPGDLTPNPLSVNGVGALFAVLFDLDGVIVDSRAHHMAAWEAWGRVHAPDADADYWHRSFGLRNDTIIGRLMPGIDAAELEQLADEKERLFRERARGNIVALPGVAALIDALDARGVSRAVVTSTPRENLDMILDAIGLAARFGSLVAAEDTTHGKPHPEGFLLGASRLGVPPERCIVIEDAPHGLEAARAAGMRAIAVTTTHPASDLAPLADLVVESLEDARVLGMAAG